MTLASVRDSIETCLSDSANLIFSTSLLDEGIRAALDGLSKACGTAFTLKDLDGAVETTFEAQDFLILIAGGAAFALSFRLAGKFEEAAPACDHTEGYHRLAQDWMNRYQALLMQVRLRKFHESAANPHSAWNWTEGQGFS